MIRLKEFTFACMLTAMVITIELLAATTGETLVALTMISTLPLYLICRENVITAVSSYLYIAFILLQINPHQLMFFLTTNGLLGLALGICDHKIKIHAICVIISGLILFVGVLVVGFVVGLIINWWIVAVLLPLCLIYTTIYRLFAGKIYVKWIAIKKYFH